jgi:hypothetical protein
MLLEKCATLPAKQTIDIEAPATRARPAKPGRLSNLLRTLNTTSTAGKIRNFVQTQCGRFFSHCACLGACSDKQECESEQNPCPRCRAVCAPRLRRLCAYIRQKSSTEGSRSMGDVGASQSSNGTSINDGPMDLETVKRQLLHEAETQMKICTMGSATMDDAKITINRAKLERIR